MKQKKKVGKCFFQTRQKEFQKKGLILKGPLTWVFKVVVSQKNLNKLIKFKYLRVQSTFIVYSLHESKAVK
jgi:hypothetical protein